MEKQEQREALAQQMNDLAHKIYDLGGRVVVINGDGQDMTLAYDAVFEVWDKSERKSTTDE